MLAVGSPIYRFAAVHRAAGVVIGDEPALSDFEARDLVV
jgi:hypothetical protein